MPVFTREYLRSLALPDEIIDDLLISHQKDMEAAAQQPSTDPFEKGFNEERS